MKTKKVEIVPKRKGFGFCPICGVSLEKENAFEEHFSLVHNKEAPSPYGHITKGSITLNILGLYCPKCGRVIERTVKAYKKHFLGVHKKRLIINKTSLLEVPSWKRYPRIEVQGGAPGLGKR
jgi:uncharacterized C2H2 Zn-finger protein